MLFLVIGIVVVVAVGALLKQTKRGPVEDASAQPAVNEEVLQLDSPSADEPDRLLLGKSPPPAPEGEKDVPGPQKDAEVETVALPAIQEEPEPLSPVLAAAPISSPSAVASATYSSAAPPTLGGDSPYSYGAPQERKKAETAPSLLRWCGKTGSLQLGDFVLLGPLTYWSDGPSSTAEPCCIDITLPVEYPSADTVLPSDGASSYETMTPLQRGVYLTWLAGGRIQPPHHFCYPALWLFGLERRVLVDRLDLGVCIGEALRIMPLLRWESLRGSLIRFVTWMAVKLWLPEEQLLAFCKTLAVVPDELLGMLLGPYANSKLPLPAIVAFTLVRGSRTLHGAAAKEGPAAPHSEALFEQFSARYRSACKGGFVLTRPRTSVFLAYVPTNPSLASEKNASGGVLELPNFFEDLDVFAPLVTIWTDLMREVAPAAAAEDAAALSDRPDLEGFVLRIRGDAAPDTAFSEPAETTLAALADLMGIVREPDSKPRGTDRKKMVETARVEGYLILPDLGIAGKEYRWEDPALLVPLEMGARLSADYCTAALLLEFACALSNPQDHAQFEALRLRLDDYLSLSTEDHARLDALRRLWMPSPPTPEACGEFLQFWLQDEQRTVLRNFLTNFLGFLPSEEHPALLGRICTALGVAPDAHPQADERPPLERGEEVVRILAPLFKNS